MLSRLNPDCQHERETSRIQCMHKWLMVLLFFWVLNSGADEPKALAPCNFQAGVDYFQKSQYEEAKTEFQNCINAPQYQSSALFNLGNIAFRQQKLGEALGFYRRYVDQHPFDREARQNLRIAWDRLKIKSIPGPVSAYETVRGQILTRVSIDLVLGITLLFLILLGVFTLRFFRTKARARISENESPAIPASLIVISLFFLVCVGYTFVKIYDTRVTRATVVSTKVDVKSGPGETNATLFEVPEGLELLILDTHEDWYQVNYPGGLSGWVPKNSVMITAGDG
jgi:hypothetical protein